MKVEVSALLLFFIGLIAFALLLSASSSRATHDASVTAIVSGDTNPLNPGPGGANPNPASALEGNFIRFDNDQNNQWDPVDANTAAMRLGPIDFCNVFPWTTASGAGQDNLAFVDIVIENVTDFTGYQVRINFDATMTTFAGALDFGATGFGGATDTFGDGFLPYRDRRSLVAAEQVSFVNLPVEDDANGHRANLQQAPPAPAGTVLLGDTYVGARSAALSADTPSANAPEGGLLVRTVWELLPASDGNLLTFDVDADTAPGTSVLVFDPGNPSGNITQVLPENHLRDFFIASDGPSAVAPPGCAGASPTPPAPPTASPSPTPTASPAPTAPPTASPAPTAPPTATPSTGPTPTPTPTPTPAAGAGTPTRTPTRAASPAALPPTGGGLPGSASAWPIYSLIVSLAVIATVGGVYAWRSKRRGI